MFVLFQICWWRPERVWSVPELRRAHGDVPLLLPGRLWTQPAEVPLVEEVRSQFYPQQNPQSTLLILGIDTIDVST